MSHGRAGWNAVTSSGEDVAANYGMRIPSSADRYGRAHETVQLVQALWGSWSLDAWVHNAESGQFANEDEIQPINMGGKFVASLVPTTGGHRSRKLQVRELRRPVQFALCRYCARVVAGLNDAGISEEIPAQMA